MNLTSEIRKLESQNRLYMFYKSHEWQELRAAILFADHYECVGCRSQARISPAVTVHHVNEVRRRPELALSEYYTDDAGKRQRNLLSLCASCHNEAHERRAKPKPKINVERWAI